MMKRTRVKLAIVTALAAGFGSVSIPQAVAQEVEKEGDGSNPAGDTGNNEDKNDAGTTGDENDTKTPDKPQTPGSSINPDAKGSSTDEPLGSSGDDQGVGSSLGDKDDEGDGQKPEDKDLVAKIVGGIFGALGLIGVVALIARALGIFNLH